jgi:hypothetical protein
MKITIHAAQRFLERVISKENYTCFDVNFAINYLEKLLQDVVITKKLAFIVLPGFEQYRAIYRDNTIITIVPKGKKNTR